MYVSTAWYFLFMVQHTETVSLGFVLCCSVFLSLLSHERSHTAWCVPVVFNLFLRAVHLDFSHTQTTLLLPVVCAVV